jgi:hypothetical protein
MDLLAIRSARGFIETNALDQLISWVLRAYATIAFAFIFLPIVALVVDLEGHAPSGCATSGVFEPWPWPPARVLLQRLGRCGERRRLALSNGAIAVYERIRAESLAA